jgi:hypothetical protein
MLRVRITRPGPLVYWRQPHLRHQTAHAAAANIMAGTPQVADHLAAAIPGHVEECRIDHPHQRQRLLGFGRWRIIVG